jgi:hypothetical protein
MKSRRYGRAPATVVAALGDAAGVPTPRATRTIASHRRRLPGGVRPQPPDRLGPSSPTSACR